MDLFNKTVELPSGVKVKYSRWDALLHGKPKIKPKTDYYIVDTIRGHNLQIFGTPKNDDRVKVSGNNNQVKDVENLDFWGKRGEVFATENPDNYNIYSNDTNVHNANNQDKIFTDSYQAEERTPFWTKAGRLCLGLLGAGGGVGGHFPGGLSNPANPLSPHRQNK